MSGIIKATNLEVTTIKDKTNTNTAISIDTSGRINIPKIPAFKCRGFGSIQNNATVNGVSVAGPGTDIIYNWDVEIVHLIIQLVYIQFQLQDYIKCLVELATNHQLIIYQ